MTKRQRVESAYAGQKPDRTPFVPAIYEHKAALIGRTPSEVCRNPEYLYLSLRRELEAYDPDMLVIGIDVYNVEAEALGCRVAYFPDSSDVPAIVEPALRTPADLSRLGVPDPERDGRMPLYLGVAGRLSRELGPDLLIRGALTGPYSMASELIGAEAFLILTVEEPESARQLMEFCAGVAVEFGKAFLRRGVEPILFDSRATPALASPRVVKQLVAPVYRDRVVPELKAAGARYLPLIIGGNTTAVIDTLIDTGATQFLADSPADLQRWCARTAAAGAALRANVDAVLVNRGPVPEIRRQALRILTAGREHPRFLLGCGVVAYDTPPEHVLAIREAIADAAAGVSVA